MSKRLAQIVCDVPEILFSAEDFAIKPDFAGVEKFCSRYALNQVQKKFHELFDSDNRYYNATKKTLEVAELQPIDFEKIFAAECLTVAHSEMNLFAIKIPSGEIFSASREDVADLFQVFCGKIILSGMKDYLKSLRITHYALRIIFDVELAAYLLYPELTNYDCENLLPLEFDGLQMIDDSPAAEATALEKLAALYEKNLREADMMNLYREIE